MFIAVLIITITSIALGQSSYKYVHTSHGQVKGELQKSDVGSSYAFLGIPYATPPTGDLRFKRPQPAKYWNGTVGGKMPAACIQYSQYPYPWYDQEPGKSEDCLYLNVRMPYSDDGKKRGPYAVLVFIYGGGFSYGSTRLDIYKGSAYGAAPKEADGFFYEPEGVISMGVGYRLGALGFLTSGTEDAPGSVGIYDLLLALHWIKDNIHAFHGDPDRITLIGQGAGSIAISLMCVSPMFEGLFKRVILHSGTFLSFKENHFPNNLRLSQRLAEAVNCSSDKTLYDNPKEVVACLRGVNATELAVALNSFHPTYPFAFYPEYNNELFPFDPVQALKDGKVHDVDMVIGGSHTEGSYLLTSMYPDEFGVFGENDKGGINKTFAESILRDAFKTYSEPEEIVDYFLKDFEGDEYQLRKQTYTALGDDGIFCPIVYFAEKYGDHTGKVHFFQFSLHPTGFPWAAWMESVHFNDGPYIFARPLALLKNDADAEELRHALVALSFRNKYAVFTATGHLDPPGRSDQTLWDTVLFSSTSQGYNFFNDSDGQDPQQLFSQTDIRFEPEKSNCDFLRKYQGF